MAGQPEGSRDALQGARLLSGIAVVDVLEGVFDDDPVGGPPRVHDPPGQTANGPEKNHQGREKEDRDR